MFGDAVSNALLRAWNDSAAVNSGKGLGVSEGTIATLAVETKKTRRQDGRCPYEFRTGYLSNIIYQFQKLI